MAYSIMSCPPPNIFTTPQKRFLPFAVERFRVLNTFSCILTHCGHWPALCQALCCVPSGWHGEERTLVLWRLMVRGEYRQAVPLSLGLPSGPPPSWLYYWDACGHRDVGLILPDLSGPGCSLDFCIYL